MRWLNLLAFSLITTVILALNIHISNTIIDSRPDKVVYRDKIIQVPVEVIKEVSIDADTIIRPTGHPVPEGVITNLNKLSGFGMRLHPVFKYKKMHTGIDVRCDVGTPILSTAYGKIIRIQYRPDGYGNNIVIEHKDGYKTLYAHLSKISVKVGENIRRGTVIGYSGNTGTSTGPHLHYEVVINGKKVDPKKYMS